MNRRKSRILTVLIGLLLVFVWGNSLLPPKASWAVSEAVKQVITALFPGDGAASGASGYLSVLIRKLAHFTEFCILGILLRARWSGRSREKATPLFLALLVALTDETIQAFTGRTSSVFDVWLDFFGAVTGWILIGIILRKRKLCIEGNEAKS